MATISAAGIGSGLDIESIITSLMDVEKIPLTKLQVKAGDLLTQVSAYGTLRSALATFQDSVSELASADNLNYLTATSGNADAYTVSADNTAVTGGYSVSVDSLAMAHKLGSDPIADSSAIGNPGDQMTITIDSEDFTVDLDGQSLASIQDLINEATDNVGVTASIVQSDDGEHLVLTSDNTGTANSISVAFTDSGGGPIPDPMGMTNDKQLATDAKITIDGYEFTRSSNTIDDAIDGLSFELLAETTTASQMTVSRDSSSISTAVSDLVENYNTLMSSFKELSSGELSGDNTLRLIESKVRNMMTDKMGVAGDYNYAFQMGMSFSDPSKDSLNGDGTLSYSTDGTLFFDSAELTAAVEADRDAVVDFFTNADDGFAVKLDSLVDGMLKTSGLIKAREDGVNARVDSTNNQIDRMQYRLEAVQARYRAQFTALDTLMGQLQSTSNWLTGQLDSLNNLMPGNSNN